MADHRLGLKSLRDEAGPIELTIEGRFPEWLSGAILRTGPAVFEVGESRFDHWFDGLAMLYRFAFEDGHVHYSNRLLQSQALEQDMSKNKIVYGDFGTTPDRNLFEKAQRILGGLGESHNANVSVIHRADGAFALTETPTQMQFDPQTLETIGPARFDDDLKGQATSAHPHTDADRQEQINYLLEFGRQSAIHVYTQPLSTRKRRLIGRVKVERPAYMHSFGLSDRYVILIEPPLRVSPLKLRFTLKPFIENYVWDEDAGTRFHLMDRADGSVTTAEGDPCFLFHQVNAFEDGDDVLIDLCAYPDAGIVDALRLDTLRRPIGPPDARLTRYRIPKRGGTAVAQVLSPESIEIPRINENACAKRRYGDVWGLSTRTTESPFFDQILRIDVKNGRSGAVWEEDQCFPTEPVFIPHPTDTGESAGVVISVVLDARRETSFLLALEAETLAELGRATLPHTVPFHFHGRHFQDAPLRDTVL